MRTPKDVDIGFATTVDFSLVFVRRLIATTIVGIVGIVVAAIATAIVTVFVDVIIHADKPPSLGYFEEIFKAC